MERTSTFLGHVMISGFDLPTNHDKPLPTTTLTPCRGVEHPPTGSNPRPRPAWIPWTLWSTWPSWPPRPSQPSWVPQPLRYHRSLDSSENVTLFPFIKNPPSKHTITALLHDLVQLYSACARTLRHAVHGPCLVMLGRIGGVTL